MSGGARARPPGPGGPPARHPEANGPPAGGRPKAGLTAAALRLPLRPNPIRLACSAAPWRAAWFLIGYLLTGWLLFSVAFTVATTAAVFAITLAGIPLALGAVMAIRGCAEFERLRLRQVTTAPVRSGYRPAPEGSILTRLRARIADPATWRDLAYLVGLWVPFTVLDTVVISIWITFAAGITVPVWYRFPAQTFDNGQYAHGLAFGNFPHGPHGPGAVGWFVATLPEALLTAAGFLVLFLLFNYVLILTARAHALAARGLLRAPADPLGPAREVLAGPGPLRPLARKAARQADGPAR